MNKTLPFGLRKGSNNTTFPCTVKGFVNKGVYGKLYKNREYIVMEMKEFLPYIKDYLPHKSTWNDNDDFKQFLNDNAGIAFNLVD